MYLKGNVFVYVFPYVIFSLHRKSSKWSSTEVILENLVFKFKPIPLVNVSLSVLEYVIPTGNRFMHFR